MLSGGESHLTSVATITKNKNAASMLCSVFLRCNNTPQPCAGEKNIAILKPKRCMSHAHPFDLMTI